MVWEMLGQEWDGLLGILCDVSAQHSVWGLGTSSEQLSGQTSWISLVMLDHGVTNKAIYLEVDFCISFAKLHLC
jgi:hypothetical protein